MAHSKAKINLKFADHKVMVLGWLTILLMGLMAYFFYLERTAILDAAYQTFAMLFHGNWAIQVDRFGAVMTKWPAYLGFKMGWDLDQIMRYYSLAFSFYLAVMFAILHAFRNEKTAILLLLFYTLLVSHTFYWIQSELLQGTAFTIFYFGLVLLFGKIKWYHLLLSVPFIITIIFFHPLAVIPFLFLWSFFLFDEPRRGWMYFGIPLIAGLVLFYKHVIRAANAYDSSSFSLIRKLGINFFTNKSNSNFLAYCTTDYYWFPILLLAGVSFYIWQKRWKRLTVLLLFVFGFLVMVNGSFPNGAEQFYIESFYQVLAVFVATPLVFDVLEFFPKVRSYTSLILLVILSVSLLRIYSYRSVYKARLDWNLSMLEKTKQMPSSKFLINERDIDMDKYLMAWGSPFETLLLSARQDPDSTRTIYIFNEGILKPESRQKRDYFLTPFGDIGFRHINKNYFNFQDTSQYIQLEKVELIHWK